MADPNSRDDIAELQAGVRQRIQQIHELEQEKHKLIKQKEEIKRLRNISRSPPVERRAGRQRSRSASKRSRRDRSHERWTNCYARKTVCWDSDEGLLV